VKTPRNPYQRGPWVPIILDRSAIETIVHTNDGLSVRLSPDAGEAVHVPVERLFDLVTPSIRDLELKVMPGTPLRNLLEIERGRWLDSRRNKTSYGCYAYFSERGDLVHYPTRELWDAVQAISSATLYRDFGLKGSFEEMRSSVRQHVPAVAGCSVGRRIAEGLSCYRFGWMKLADKKPGHPSGNNRAPHTYEEMTRHDSKASSLARRFYAEDGLSHLSVYREGIHPGNIDDFVGGNSAIDEPAATIVFDETDDLVSKLDLRVACRKFGIAYAMVTDLGRWSLVELCDWKQRPDLPLVTGSEDTHTLELLDALRQDPDNMFLRRRGTMALIGGADMLRGELKNIVQGINQRGGDSPPLADPPQDGSTCLFGGVVAPRLLFEQIAGTARSGRRLLDPLHGEVLRQDW
jgi:hypothetical protein